MLKYIKADITTMPTGIIVQGVNCQGVMGSGVARTIRDKWPQVFNSYKEFCSNHKSSDLLGKVNFVSVGEFPSLFPSLVVANIFSQEYYGRDGRAYASVNAIGSGLEQVLQFAYDMVLPVYSVKLGCGLGGLSWENDIEGCFNQVMKRNPTVSVTICEQ